MLRLIWSRKGRRNSLEQFVKYNIRYILNEIWVAIYNIISVITQISINILYIIYYIININFRFEMLFDLHFSQSNWHEARVPLLVL